MQYHLVGSPSVETHNENLMRLFVRDVNGAPIANAHVRVWGGPPPTGLPPYFVDNVPFRLTNPSGMLEYFSVIGPMPDARDYWMQVLADDGTVQSDPVQFHFPGGSTIWIMATLQAGDGSGGGTTPVPGAVQWDSRLDAMHVSIAPVVGLAPGQPYWKIISAQYQDEVQAGGNHNLYYTALDENGFPAAGAPTLIDWQGREPNDIPDIVYTDGNGTANYAIYGGPVGWNPGAGPGPYMAWVGDPDLRGNKPSHVPGEKFVGAGLPMNRHVNFVVTWRKIASAIAAPLSSSVRGILQNAPANVLLTLTSSAHTFSTNADAAGVYAFTDLPAGTYALAIAGAGVVNPGLVLDGTNAITFNYSLPAQPPSQALTHYLLFGSSSSAAARTNLILALDYITRFAPTVGFSLDEARSARNVTVVGNGVTSAADEQALVSAGCTVRHIAGADSYAVQQLFQQLVASGNPYPGV